jgi:release factor glutamine methyltransferase
MTVQSAQLHALTQLKLVYDEREAANITDWVMEHVTGQKKIARLLDKHYEMPGALVMQLEQILQELSTHRPVQYVLGEAWFAGMRFYVNEHTLIPRPETEELVDWIVEEIKNSKLKIKNILDIGTGSGCIPIALKKKLPAVDITSIDVSEEALQVARQNAETLEADISLSNIDFLDEANWKQLAVFDLIVSNPPYIKHSEQKNMAKNVLDFEPAIALFVPDEDALLFYRKIAAFSKMHLTKGGSIFLEINEALGDEVSELYRQAGYDVELRKDLQGKNRMAKVNLKI